MNSRVSGKRGLFSHLHGTDKAPRGLGGPAYLFHALCFVRSHKQAPWQVGQIPHLKVPPAWLVGRTERF